MLHGRPNVGAAAGDDPQRNETGLRLAVSDAVLEPTNPFEPKKETSAQSGCGGRDQPLPSFGVDLCLFQVPEGEVAQMP
jgi:hypothetical protein